MTDANLRILPDLEQGSEEWHDQRRGMVAASVVGKLLTPTLKVADNDTSRGLTATLVAERITGWTEETAMTLDMWRGVECEPIARDRYAEVNGVEVAEVGFAVRTFDGAAQLGASPDGLVGEVGGLEIKAPRAKTHLRTVIAGEVPAHYMAQIQASLLVFGREWWDFVSFCGGMPLFVKRVYPDQRWHEAIAEAVMEFERTAERMTSEYLTAAEGLPLTERVADLGVVI